jgi:hypothetical protein
MTFAAKDGGVKVGHVGFTGFSFAETIAGLKALAERPADEVDAGDLRKLVPTVGTVRMADLSVDMAPAPAAPARPAAPRPERVRFGSGRSRSRPIGRSTASRPASPPRSRTSPSLYRRARRTTR